MINRLPELLCPAGDEAALRAAVDCGADAVYLGYKAYGARASAVNFDDAALCRAVSYAHLYHARVHVTVNTLVKEDELPGVRQALSAIQSAGADAVIVQDLGVAQLVRNEFPSLQLHASTQMALSNAADAKFAKDAGFARVVLARECALSDVRKAADTGIETEVFAHGALCASVSGRCLASSMAGGRSGNRGRCAQPCRMTMSINGWSGALLSLRDLCTWQDLPAICEAGVTSLKLEGRLKSADYVAVVTQTYRAALDAIAAGLFDPDDPRPKERLMQIFNRGGFTRGHLMGAQDSDLCSPRRVSHEGLPLGKVLAVKGSLAQLSVSRALHNGDSLQLRDREDADLRYSGPEVRAGGVATLHLRPDIHITVGAEAARLSDAEQLTAARGHQPKPIPVSMTAAFRLGSPMTLTMSDGCVTVCAAGDIIQPANSRAAAMNEVKARLLKLGETPFTLSDPDGLTVTLDEGIFLPVSALNSLRRDAADKLTAARIAAFHQAGQAHCQKAPPNAARPLFDAPLSSAVTAETLAISFAQPELAEPLRAQGASLLIYRPADYREDALGSALDLLPEGTWLKLPPQSSERTLQGVLRTVSRRRQSLGGLVAGSFGQLGLTLGLPIIAGEELPVTNREAMALLAGLSGFCLWPEWTAAEQLALLPHALPALLKVYGRETLMLLNHCPARAMGGMTCGRDRCTLCKGAAMACGQDNAELRDQKGYRFPLRRTVFPEGCLLSMLNALPTDLRAFDADRRRLNAGMLLVFTTEPPERQLALTADYSALLKGSSLPKADGMTAGHWRRGVE